MPTEVIMPALGMAQDTGKLVRWLLAPGSEVAEGEPLMEIETDKATVEIEAPAAGVLAGVRAAEGDDVPVGEVVALILAPGEDGAAAPAPAREEHENGGGRRLASPKARRLARERGISLERLPGSGPHGAVLAADVEAAAAAAAPPAAPHMTAPQVPAPAGPDGGPAGAMAALTAASWRDAPHFHLHREVDAARLLDWRAAAVRRLGPGVTLTDLLLRVVARSLREHPALNACWRDGGVSRLDEVGIAIAVALEDGLILPVLRRADTLTLAQIAEQRAALVERARERRLALDDVRGASFTLSNLGMYGVDSFDAVLSQGQAGLLAVGRVRERVVPYAGVPAIRPQLDLGLALDHRIVDGARGAVFLASVAELVAEPALLVD
jgi:pyruvate dehydrogenase E2 component (dihydrolipoamide acetyltransferase)